MLPAFFQDFLSNYGYLAVFLILLLCGAGLPLPEDIVLVSAGIVSALGKSDVHIMVIVSYLGILVGDLLMYSIGRRWGPLLMEKAFFKKVLHEQRLQQVDNLFIKYGNMLIFVARFLPGLRAPIYIITGMMRRVSALMFVLMDSLAALLSVPVFVYLGFYGAENREWLMETIEDFKYLTIALFVLLAIFYGIRFYRAYKRREFYRQTRKLLKERNRA